MQVSLHNPPPPALRALAALRLRALRGQHDTADGEWERIARPEQLPPDGNWRIWCVLAGRGFGKTRLGAEWVNRRVRRGEAKNLVIAGPTAADVRDVMIEGPAGILNCASTQRPRYESSKRRLVWPNGAWAITVSADEPERFRGLQADTAWTDELAAWRYPEAWDQLMFGLRLGANPQALVTTTPRPTKIIRALIARDGADVRVVRGSTYDNRANLAPGFFDDILRRYEGTRLGRQEINAEILDDVPGALWQRNEIERNRVERAPENLIRIVVGLDPAVTSEEDSDETGIVSVGKSRDGHYYVLDDRSLRGTPDEWGRRAVGAWRDLRADRIVGEANQGGEMISHTIRTVHRGAPVKLVHASRGKITRAEPVAALSEQNKVHFVGAWPKLEDQLCTWCQGDKSPDRLDAFVWAVTELGFGALGGGPPTTTSGL